MFFVSSFTGGKKLDKIDIAAQTAPKSLGHPDRKLAFCGPTSFRENPKKLWREYLVKVY